MFLSQFCLTNLTTFLKLRGSGFLRSCSFLRMAVGEAHGRGTSSRRRLLQSRDHPPHVGRRGNLFLRVPSSFRMWHPGTKCSGNWSPLRCYSQHVLLISCDAVEVLVEVQNEGGDEGGFSAYMGDNLSHYFVN